MILYTHRSSPRLEYIAAFAGRLITGEPLVLVHDKDAFRNAATPRINYSEEKISDDELQIIPHSLLFEDTVRVQDTACFPWNGRLAFFRTNGDIPFDIFAASFYLLSRYEEYLPHSKDMYGRYAHEQSLAFRENFLDIPLVNHWVLDLRTLLQQKFPAFQPCPLHYSFLPTYDIDEAFAYKHKGWIRTNGARLKAWLRGDLRDRLDRSSVLEGKMDDPFDSYAWMDELHSIYDLHPRYFFLLPSKTSKYDRNILPDQPALQEIIRKHAARYETGIHPSWQTGDDPSLFAAEMQTLEKITGTKPVLSRQHFIRFNLPDTFRHLIEAGIQEDHSMGYGAVNGFRASVITPFFWYDLSRDETTSLLLRPYCFMEANAFFEQKITAVDALHEMRRYEAIVKKVSGEFSCIWHNTFLGTFPVYAGWRDVYEAFIRGRD